MKTRKKKFCPVFGLGTELKDNILPTYRDCMKNYLLLRNNYNGITVNDLLIESYRCVE